MWLHHSCMTYWSFISTIGLPYLQRNDSMIYHGCLKPWIWTIYTIYKVLGQKSQESGTMAIRGHLWWYIRLRQSADKWNHTYQSCGYVGPAVDIVTNFQKLFSSCGLLSVLYRLTGWSYDLTNLEGQYSLAVLIWWCCNSMLGRSNVATKTTDDPIAFLCLLCIYDCSVWLHLGLLFLSL